MKEKKAGAVFSSVLGKVKPSARERRESLEAAQALVARLEAAAPASVEIAIAGSLAKGTSLSGNNEFDIFLLFPRHYPHHEMAMLGLAYARRAFRGMRVESRYAEHPYLQVYLGKYHADIVPAYRIDDIGQRGSAVDRSALHTKYVNARLAPAQKDDVLLLKKFMKNFGIYGAELRVEGFSGYLCELLVAHYGSLLPLMEAAAGWKESPVIIDVEKHHADHAKLREKFNAPLIVVDPVDPGRNVAAVVSQASLSRFIFECRRFLAAPSPKFFFLQKKAAPAKQIRKALAARGTSFLLLSFPAPKVVPDVLWPQLRKTAGALCARLSSLEFSVFGSSHWSDGKECAVLFELDRASLPPVKKAVGPSVKFAADVESFVKKHKKSLNLHIEHGRMAAVEKREFTSAAGALKAACKKPQGLGVPANMERMLPKARLYGGRGCAKARYAMMLSGYLFMKIA
jgi:tRNA nucleotidyltransferase (CCA-adding enzyme)